MVLAYRRIGKHLSSEGEKMYTKEEIASHKPARIRARRPRRYGVTWTKNITRWLLMIGVAGGVMPYLLSLMGKEPVERLGEVWITAVVMVTLGYFVRGFKDTKSEEDMRFKRDMAGLTESDDGAG